MHKIKPVVLWMTGLSGAGKSTLAYALEKKLQSENILAEVLDGDVLRSGINAGLGFSDEDRNENIRRAAEVAKVLWQNQFVVICSLITPTNNLRNVARKVLGNYMKLIHISTPLDVCKQRDVKGLYGKAMKGEIKEFTGISAPFDLPESPDLELNTDNVSENQCVDMLYAFLRNISN